MSMDQNRTSRHFRAERSSPYRRSLLLRDRRIVQRGISRFTRYSYRYVTELGVIYCELTFQCSTCHAVNKDCRVILDYDDPTDHIVDMPCGNCGTCTTVSFCGQSGQVFVMNGIMFNFDRYFGITPTRIWQHPTVSPAHMPISTVPIVVENNTVPIVVENNFHSDSESSNDSNGISVSAAPSSNRRTLEPDEEC